MAASDIALVHRTNYVGAESLTAPGVAVPAVRQLAALDIAMAPQFELAVTGPQGQKADTLAILNKEWSVGDVSGAPTYDELIVPFASIFGNTVVDNAPGGITLAKRWRFVPSPVSRDTVQTYTLKKGRAGYNDAQQTPGAIFTEFGMSLSKSGGNTLSGSVMGVRSTQEQVVDGGEKQSLVITGSPLPTGGTFTLTFSGQTTAAIPWNATPAQTQAALVALSNVPDTDVSVSGGQLPGGTQVISFGGSLATSDQPLITITTTGLTGGTGVTGTLTQVTAFGPITAYPLVPIAPGQVCVYLDDTAAAIGTHLLNRDFVVDWAVTNRQNPVWPLNCQLASYDGTIETKPDPTVSLKLGNNPEARALYDTMRAGGRKYLRIEATGAVIDGTASYRLRLDGCVVVADNPAPDDEDGLSTITFPFRYVQDAVAGMWLSAELINTQTAL